MTAWSWTSPRRATRAAVVAAMVVGAAASLLMGVRSAPWGFIDERVHGAYLVELSRGVLPTLDTPLPGLEDQDYSTRTAMLPPNSRGEPVRQLIWVANHPPGAYLVAVPPTWLTMRLGHETLVIAWLRGASAIGVALVVGFTALLARSLTADRRTVILAAGLTAVAPYMIGMGAQGMTDTTSLAAAVAGTWAATEIVRRGLTRASVAIAACALVGAGLTRISALAAAIVAIAVGVGIDAVRRRRIPWRAALVPLPAAVLTGWFYVRNIVLYGDPAASAEIMHRYDRRPVGWSFALTRWTNQPEGPFRDGWWTIWNIVLTGTTEGPGIFDDHYVGSIGAGLIVACIAASIVVVVVERVRHRGDPRFGLVIWLPTIFALVATFLGAVDHVSGGGLAHPRYLLFVVPVAACLVGRAVSLLLRGASGPSGLLGLVPVIALGLFTATRDWDAALPSAGGFLIYDRIGPGWIDAVLLTVIALAASAYLVAASVTWRRPV